MSPKKIDHKFCLIDDPVPPDDVRDELDASEYHLITELGYSILEVDEPMEPRFTESEQEMIDQFPIECSDPHASTYVGYDPELTPQWYEGDVYDRVLTCNGKRTKESAERILFLRCVLEGAIGVGDVYKSGRFWCVRVRDV